MEVENPKLGSYSTSEALGKNLFLAFQLLVAASLVWLVASSLHSSRPGSSYLSFCSLFPSPSPLYMCHISHCLSLKGYIWLQFFSLPQVPSIELCLAHYRHSINVPWMSRVAPNLRTQEWVCLELHTVLQRVHGIGIKRRSHKLGKKTGMSEVGETNSPGHQSGAGRR